MKKNIKISHTSPTPSEYAKKLKQALETKDVFVKLEQFVGDKHVDLSIPSAKLDIEVDGYHHLMNSKQILKDLSRGYYSHKDGYNTIHIPNIMLDIDLEQVAHALAEAIKTIEFRLQIK